MDEVSNRAFSYFEEAERAGWIHLDELVAGSGLRLVDLRDPRKRTDWEDWVFLCARFESLVGTERLEESAVFGVTSAFAGDMAKVASLFVDPLELYRAGLEWAGAANYRCIRFSVKPHQGGALQVEARLEEQHAQSRAWFAMLRGGLAVIPRFVGLADAVVEGEISATHLSCRVIPPPSRTLALAGRRFLSTLLAPRALVDELTFQQEQLQATSLELQRSERDVRDTLARLPAMVGLVRDERLTYANETLLEALGTDLRGARARDLLAWIAPPDRAAFRSAVLDERSTGEVVVRIEGRSTRWARASGFTMPAAQRLRGFYAVDVTEEQAARAGMLHHDETLRAMSSALPDLVARIDGEGRVLDLLGSSWGAFDLRGAVGRRLDELDDRTGPRLRTADVAHLLRLTRSELDRVELTLGPERDRIFEWTATRVANKDEWLLVGRDVTSRRAAERQLAIAERMASLGTLAAAVGHEINNPLAYVIMNQEVVLEGLARLAEGGALDLEELRSAARDARHGAERVRGIVRHLKRFSRLDATDVGSVDLRAVIAEAIAMTATEARLRARVIEDLDEVPAVSGDEGALVQVFVNLLANAAQAIPEGDPASNRIEVKTDRQGELVRVRVSDTGSGIPSEHLARIFDPFFTTKQPGAGTGLGLSVSLKLIHDAGGTLTVESQVGRGTTFTVLLRPAQSSSRAQSAPTRSGERLRVLLVDDEPLLLRGLSRVLAHHHVVAASSVEEALAQLAADGFDVIVCDLHMPGPDGVDLYRNAVARDPRLARRFVFLTGGAFTARSAAFVEEGHTLIEKPVRNEHLEEVLARVAREAAASALAQPA